MSPLQCIENYRKTTSADRRRVHQPSIPVESQANLQQLPISRAHVKPTLGGMPETGLQGRGAAPYLKFTSSTALPTPWEAASMRHREAAAVSHRGRRISCIMQQSLQHRAVVADGPRSLRLGQSVTGSPYAAELARA